MEHFIYGIVIVVITITYGLTRELWNIKYRYKFNSFYIAEFSKGNGDIIYILVSNPEITDDYSDMVFLTTRTPLSKERIKIAVKHENLRTVSSFKKLYRLTKMFKRHGSHSFNKYDKKKGCLWNG